MVSFHRPESLWVLLLLPILALLWVGWQRWQQRVLSQWRGAQKSPAGRPGLTTLILSLLIFALIIVAWAGPFNPKVSEQKPASGVDLMVALDCSKSMHATDLKPDRLSRAVSLINRLATLRPGDRIGLLVFAGRAYHSVPLTTDRTVLRMGLESATPESLPTQGTVLSEAIRAGATAFTPNQRRAKVLLLLTDGEDHDAGAPDAAMAAQEAGIHLFAVGVGSPAGTTLAEADGTLKTDAQGKPVITRLGEESLRALVTGHGGKYWRLESTGGTAASIADALAPLPSTPVSLPADAEGYEYFPLIAGGALLLLLLQMLIPFFHRLSKRNQRQKPALALLIFLLGIPVLSTAQTAWQEGDKLYRSGKFSEAAAAYKKALSDTAAKRAAGYNLGNALYRAGKFEEAQKAYEVAKGAAKTGRASYNEGNSWAEQKKWKEAMEAYKEALRREPTAQDAQYNYNYARAQQQAKEEKEKKEQQQQKQDPSQPEKENPKGEPKKPEPNPSKLTKEEADRLLKSLQREEEKTGEKRKGQPSQDMNPEKDW